MRSTRRLSALTAIAISMNCVNGVVAEEGPPKPFNAERDLISLHYDHAPDKDDGHSAAADRMILETIYGCDWIKVHVLAVSGAYGENKNTFNPKSDHVMNVAFNDCGGWVAADSDWDAAVARLLDAWMEVLLAGGDIWVKEGGQSDITADVVKLLEESLPDVDLKQRLHVVQHSNWNEDKTTDVDLAFVKERTNYLRIRDANRYLNKLGGDLAFQKAALNHDLYGHIWKAAFQYYDPAHRLDFSDTGELFYMLGLGELGLDEVRTRFLKSIPDD